MRKSIPVNSTAMMQTYVHPCVINQQPHIVYPRGLKENSPELFRKLSRHYKQKGYALKEDQRADNPTNKYQNERRKWAPIMLFTASLLFESHVYADTETEHKGAVNLIKPQHIELQLIAKNTHGQKLTYSKEQITRPVIASQITSAEAQEIFDILVSRYQKMDRDPGYIENDLVEMANYYSGFPQTQKLFVALKNKNWVLSFDESEWFTTANGSALQIDKAIVHFNTRSAAQLRLNNGCKANPVCIASPADALLHELLHVYSMLVKDKKSLSSFIQQGGMNNVIYPYQHEYAVIDSERKLYASMSKYDQLKRPQRREHTGRLVRASCATCIK